MLPTSDGILGIQVVRPEKPQNGACELSCFRDHTLKTAINNTTQSLNSNFQLTMETHALAILKAAELWDRSLTHTSGSRSGKLRAITPKLLSCFIHESQALGGTLVDQFWDVFGRCHPKLAENSVSNVPPALNTRRYLFISAKTLKDTPFFSMHHSEAVLFEGINRNSVDFDPIYQLAAELFTHLCIACGS